MEQPMRTLYGGRSTKMCASVIPFIPFNQLSILIINFRILISNKINTTCICCNLCNFSIFQPSSRAQGFGAKFRRTKLHHALLTDRCAI